MKKNYLQPAIEINTLSIEAIMMSISDTPMTEDAPVKEEVEIEDFENFFD